MNNTECTRRIRARKAVDISRTLAIMIRNNRGRLAQHQRVTERAHRPIQAALSPGGDRTSVFPSRPESWSRARAAGAVPGLEGAFGLSKIHDLGRGFCAMGRKR